MAKIIVGNADKIYLQLNSEGFVYIDEDQMAEVFKRVLLEHEYHSKRWQWQKRRFLRAHPEYVLRIE